MKLTISLGQFDVHIGDPDHNLARVADWIAEAARRSSDVVVFPELWDSGYALDRAADLGSPIDEGRFARIAALAHEHHIHVIGSMLEYTGLTGTTCNAYNTAVWFTPEGEAAGVYRKVHLFPLMDEDRYLLPGQEPLTLSMPWGVTGVAICYDLRFPELFRHYALAGAILTILPAQWPYPRTMHWQTLLRARAIENQMFMVACNRVGKEGKAVFGGRSAIYNASGETIVEAGDEEVLLTATIDLSTVAGVREFMPVFRDRRPEVYDRMADRARAQ